MIIVELSSQPIELYKLLKIANLVGGGGEAKIVISEGYVAVNEEVVTQKRKKIYDGDVIYFNGEVIQMQCDAPITEPVKKSKPKSSTNTKAAANIPGGRRKISF
ncbi:RNA-binding S4 domain-containing protein [Thalassotalea marina]|uniref:RNA-binding S4 domain-containing protein n=1 Tax=Thalassotalea marina TaxID=1673741 RepID=A0A919BRN1_9GAMM|nr:RNA-binding S4 domain-containing protein [Thalassotalea marina]GHG08380.1 hypothetical protein GCM10017161_42680 [Thalassotalea marina]